MRQTKCVILVISSVVELEIRRLGNSPGHSLSRRISLLRTHSGGSGTLEQRIGITTQPKRRHQEFEHRSGPRKQHRQSTIQRVRPAEQEPTLLRDILLGNGHKHSRARLGPQQVVASGMEMMSLDIEADRHQITSFVQQGAEVHVVGKLARLLREPSKLVEEVSRVLLCLHKCAMKTLVQTASFISRGMGGPLALSKKLVDKFRHLLESKVVHQFEVESRILPQRRKLRREPRGIVTNSPADFTNP